MEKYCVYNECVFRDETSRAVDRIAVVLLVISPEEKNEARYIGARAPLSSLPFFSFVIRAFSSFSIYVLRLARANDEFDIRGRRAGRFVQFFFTLP